MIRPKLMAALLLSALSASAQDFPPSFDLAPAPGVWVSFDKADLAKPEAAKFPLAKPVAADGRTSVFKVAEHMLPVLSQFMHDRFKRCGGFFTYATEARARASMTKSAVKAVPVAYTLDQRAVVTPLAAAVDEARIRAVIETMAAHNNRYYRSATGVQAAAWLKGVWSGLAANVPGASSGYFPHASWAQPSVILTIPGSETPDEIVILGGHLDSINGWGDSASRAPGADDNASGIAVLTEAARLLAESGYRPKRTIQFMAYAAEEVGLRGSQEIAARYAASGKNVVGVIQFDMSNFAGSGPGIFMLTDNVDPALSAFTAALVDAYTGVKAGSLECGYGCSDHASWNAEGYPAAMAFESTFEGMNHAIHTDLDTLATAGGTAAHSVPFAKLAVAFAVELAKTSGAGPIVVAPVASAAVVVKAVGR